MTSPVFTPGRWRRRRARPSTGGRSPARCARRGACAKGCAPRRAGRRGTEIVSRSSERSAPTSSTLAPALAAERGEALAQSVSSQWRRFSTRSSTGADAASAFRALAAVFPGARRRLRLRGGVAAAGARAADDPSHAGAHPVPARRRAWRARRRGDRRRRSPEVAASFVSYLGRRCARSVFGRARAAGARPGAGRHRRRLVRDLDEVRATIAVYATRLARVRAAVQALIGPDATPVWLPPDLSPLLPGGRCRCGERAS